MMLLPSLFTSTFLSISTFLPFSVAYKQGIAVRGRLLCGTTPLEGALVKIIDIDTDDPDDLLNMMLTDVDGRFSLFGVTEEDEEMRAAIKVYHDCNDGFRVCPSLATTIGNKVCQRKHVWEVPPSYNNNGTIERWFDTGTLNMAMLFRGEERDCRH